MANPRNTVAFDGIGEERATYKIDGDTIVYDATQARGAAAATLDKAVTLTADDTVGLVADAGAIVGKLLLVEPDGKCLVQIGGYCTLPAGEGATVTRGKKAVGDLGPDSAKGYIRDAASGTAAEAAAPGPRIEAVGTTTAVRVWLG